MRDFPRPEIVISKCIEFGHCRYDGGMIPSDFVKALKTHADFIPVCAEMEIGLGVPRDSIRIISKNGDFRLVQPATSLDFTEKMSSFTSRFLDSLSGIDGFILKYRSPTCGMKGIKVYSGFSESGAVFKASGFFGGPVVKTFPYLAIEDEGRLRNFNIRDHFLTKLYTLASFRGVENEASVSALIEFHTANKLLLAAHSQKESKILGNIVANREKLDFAEQSGLYKEHLGLALKRPIRYTSRVNVLMHSFGYFSDELSRDEKALFLQIIAKYKNKKIPSSGPMALLQSWIVRYGEDYLRRQTLFEPYPEQLVELCQDSQCEWAGERLFQGRENEGRERK